jgi:hypothetical protein
MCTITNQEPPQGIVDFPRDINVLLSLNTYQGMTDEEIDMLLDYKIKQAVNSRETLAMITAQTVRMNEMIEVQLQSCKNQDAMLESLIKSNNPTFEYVKPTVVNFDDMES